MNWYAPDYTFAATGLAVIKANKVLNLCDVGIENWRIQTSELLVDPGDIGLMPVMPFGASVDFSEYINFETVIIDAAASLGRTPPDFTKMPSGWGVVYSLHATKVLGAGEGGMVVCGNEETAEELRSWINFGFGNERTAEIRGTNAKMSEFNAAYGLTSLRTFHASQKKWVESQALVAEFAQERAWLTWVNSSPAFQPYWIIDLKDSAMKNHIEIALDKLGIQSRSWWAKPLSMQNAFRSSKRVGSLSNSNKLALRHLGLPMFPGLSGEDIKFIVSAIDQGIENYGKII
jgi:dTDP-4-amino-4,6-dideoxygalactose transaminase